MIIIPNSFLLLGLAATGIAALTLGGPTLTPIEAWQAVADPGAHWHTLVTEVRAPRYALGALVGAGLAVAGLLLQDVLRNPIAGPELLGVSSGAAAVVATIVVFGLAVPLAVQPWLALVGALVAGLAVLLAIGRPRDVAQVALVGAAVSAAGGGVVIAIVGLGTQGNVVVLFRYLLGSLAARGWPHLDAVAPILLGGVALAWMLRRRIDALVLGDDVAAGLGVAVTRTRVQAMALAALLAAASAAVCGPIAFVALLAPHLGRALIGTRSFGTVLPTVALIGALLLALADLVSRLVLHPVELPVSIATTALGVPGLIVLGRRMRITT